MSVFDTKSLNSAKSCENSSGPGKLESYPIYLCGIHNHTDLIITRVRCVVGSVIMLLPRGSACKFVDFVEILGAKPATKALPPSTWTRH